jgi:hypothetical protein
MFFSEYVGFPSQYNSIYLPRVSFIYHRRYLTLVTDLSQGSGKSGIGPHFTTKVSILASQLSFHQCLILIYNLGWHNRPINNQAPRSSVSFYTKNRRKLNSTVDIKVQCLFHAEAFNKKGGERVLNSITISEWFLTRYGPILC